MIKKYGVVIGLAIVSLGLIGAVAEKLMSKERPDRMLIRTENDNQEEKIETVNEKCVVTISGQKYDVTNLIGSHPGGDVFSGKCGTDMTVIYQNQHGSSLERIKEYMVKE